MRPANLPQLVGPALLERLDRHRHQAVAWLHRPEELLAIERHIDLRTEKDDQPRAALHPLLEACEHFVGQPWHTGEQNNVGGLHIRWR